MMKKSRGMPAPTDALPTEGNQDAEQASSLHPLVLYRASGEFQCKEAMKEKLSNVFL